LYHASRGIREEDVTSILQRVVVIEQDPGKAEMHLVALPGLRKFNDNLKTEKEKEDFRRHLRRYINIYMPDCPFEVSSTNRYTVVTHEAAITARRLIKKGETIKYLCGVQVIMTPEEEADINERRRDFSIVVSSRNKSASIFLGPARFANHDCGANARLMTTGHAGMEIIAAQDIEIGDEITVTYGDNYFGEDNCECLCKTCEDRLQNGWELIDDVDDENPKVTPQQSIEQEMTGIGAYSLRRRRNLDSKGSSRDVSTTPDIRPHVPKRSPKKPTTLAGQVSSPALSIASQPVETPLARKRTREVARLSLGDPPHQKKVRAAKPFIKNEEISSSLTELYSTPSSSRSSSIFDRPAETSPLSLTTNGSSTDATSVDEETIGVATRRRRKAVTQNNSHSQINAASKVAMDQITSSKAIIVGPSTSDDHHVAEAIADAEIENDDSAIQPRSLRKLKRPSTKLLTKTLAGQVTQTKRKYTKRKAVLNTDLDHAPKIRTPGDYVLTPLLLAQPASAWISCKICDGFFVQLDAYFTRSSCPRCERHSKLYGYQWPKTDKTNRYDTEERVTDHRTVHRFIRPDEERAIRKRNKSSSTDVTSSVSRTSSAAIENEEEVVTEEEFVGRRRSARSRKQAVR
jgi:histone-lysine N-methyltransferase SUV420H